MDRNELKQTLLEQVEPMDEAVQKKLAYLNSDDVFTNQDLMPEPEDVLGELLMQENMAPQPLKKNAEPTDTADKIAMHKHSLVEKIAALRGISSAVPNEYINRKI